MDELEAKYVLFLYFEKKKFSGRAETNTNILNGDFPCLRMKKISRFQLIMSVK